MPQVRALLPCSCIAGSDFCLQLTVAFRLMGCTTHCAMLSASFPSILVIFSTAILLPIGLNPWESVEG